MAQVKEAGGVTSQKLPPALAHHEVLPSQTDPKITDPNDTHEVYLQVGGAGDRLFIFFPGTGQKPDQFNKILMTAANAGYHAIAVDYPDKVELPQACANLPDCYGPARREILEGHDTSPKVDVDADNCILNRIRKLLEFLNTQFPSEHWGQFMTNGHINWSKVTVAGHSQGGGHAAFIARFFNVNRVVMFSSANDAVNGPNWTSATWLGQPHTTPSDRYFAFGETNDSTFFPRMTVNWETLGLPGSLTSVDNSAPPYNNSHRLTTSRQLQSPHNDVIRDSTPLTPNGRPVYEPVWKYLIGP